MGKTMDKVSVIVPFYNNKKYIKACVDSIRSQTYQNLEILLIDDGSTDAGGELLESYTQVDKRIRLIRQKNQGVADARNRGLDEAEGKYVTFIDGDDYIAPDYIEKFYRCAVEKKLEMVICGLTLVDENGKVLKKIIPDGYKRYEKEEWTFRISAVCSHFYLRSLWEKYEIRFRTGARGEDMPISLFFSAECAKIGTLAECGYYYVQHKNSAMHNFKGLKNYQLPYQALEESIKKVQKLGIKNSPEFYELFVLRILCTCFFELGRGASRDKLRELCQYIRYILKNYFPEYDKNPKTKIFSGVNVPLSQKVAVKLLICLVKSGLLETAAILLSF